MKELRTAPGIILVAEDDVLTRLSAVTALGRAGFAVVDAASADAALILLEQRADIRLVFSDVNMPGHLNGLELAFEVRRRWPAIGLLLTSGDPRPVDLAMLGGPRFLPKPCLNSDLIAAIAAFPCLAAFAGPVGHGRRERFLPSRRRQRR